MSRFVLVEIEPGLDRSRHTGIWCAVRLIPGVRSLTDISAISAETLNAILWNPPAVVPLSAPASASEHTQQLEMPA
jgi:hypothetical protein